MKKTITFSSAEEAIENSRVIIYNENSIEFPGALIISKKKKSFAYQALNPDIEVMLCEEEELQGLLVIIDNLLGFSFISEETLTYPKSKLLVNAKKIEEDAFFVIKEEKSIKINDYTFTNSKLEFYGASMFSKKKIFF